MPFLSFTTANRFTFPLPDGYGYVLLVESNVIGAMDLCMRLSLPNWRIPLKIVGLIGEDCLLDFILKNRSDRLGSCLARGLLVKWRLLQSYLHGGVVPLVYKCKTRFPKSCSRFREAESGTWLCDSDGLLRRARKVDAYGKLVENCSVLRYPLGYLTALLQQTG